MKSKKISVNQKSQNNDMKFYTPDTAIRSPGYLFKNMWHGLMDSWGLAWRLFIRDLTAQYRQSMLGIFWSFVPPLLTSIIFIALQTNNIIKFDNVDIPYPIFVLTGTILWQLFTESLNAPLKALLAARPILTKLNFPYEALILSAIYMVIFNLGFKLIILLSVLLYFQVKVTLAWLLFPFALSILIIFGIGLGLLLTPIGLLYSDVSSAIPVLTQIWFFATPVVYSPPDTFPFTIIALVNPLSPLIVGTRDIVTRGVMTSPEPFMLISGLAVFILIVAWIVYRVAPPIIIERTSA